MARTIHSTTIPSSTTYLGDVRSFIEKYARRADLPEPQVEQVKIAVDEACTNVIEHAYKNEEGHQIDLAIIIEPERLIVRIRDSGVAFQRSEYEEPDLVSFVKRRKSGGFGVHIMHRLMDEVEYNTVGNFNECCLIKKRVTTNGTH
ncbi:MAG: ATP-binding protein [Bacteroidota bacterium]